jgi:pyruvate/2-oxoglutarate dehydrogenase complex dihydrolipoamide dehydrogenase (E3) component
MMIRAADLITEGRRIPGMAGRAEVVPDWAPVARRIRDEATDDWDDEVAADRFTGKGGILVRGHGRITAPGEVTVTPAGGPATGEAQVLRARLGIVIATGSTAAVPPIPGLADTPFWTNHEAIEAEQVPQSLVVLGGGAVGAELAQVFARFGSQVSIAEGADRLLPLEEPEAGDLLAGVFARDGLAVRTGRQAAAVSRSPWRAERNSPARRCWWPPAAAPTSPLSAPGRQGSTSGCGPFPWTGTCAPRPECGRWATSPARAPSPTCPCTRRASSSTTFWGASTAPPSTTRCPGSPSPTRR